MTKRNKQSGSLGTNSAILAERGKEKIRRDPLEVSISGTIRLISRLNRQLARDLALADGSKAALRYRKLETAHKTLAALEARRTKREQSRKPVTKPVPLRPIIHWKPGEQRRLIEEHARKKLGIS